jgi:solute carrier family 44 protein 1 (choline transporter-like protein)/choline transporter-like protein 2/4/5
MIASNPLRYGAIEGVGLILMLMGKLIIAGLTTFLFYLLITFVSDIRANVQEPIYLLIIVFIAAFAIAVVFMAVYTVAMETILACFIVDEATGGAHGPPDLKELIDNQ